MPRIRRASIAATVAFSVILAAGGAAATRPEISEGETALRAAPLSPAASAKTTSVRIYLIAIGDNGRSGARIGCGDSLVPVVRHIPPTTAPLSAAMSLLLGDHHRSYGRSGLYNPLYQSRLRLQKARVVDGKATVYLVGTMRLSGECDNPRVGAQLRQTVRQFSTVRSVAIFVNNVPLWKRLSLKG